MRFGVAAAVVVVSAEAVVVAAVMDVAVVAVAVIAVEVVAVAVIAEQVVAVAVIAEQVVAVAVMGVVSGQTVVRIVEVAGTDTIVAIMADVISIVAEVIGTITVAIGMPFRGGSGQVRITMGTTTTTIITIRIRSLAAMVADAPNGIADVSRTGVIAIPITSDACAFTNVVDANHVLLRMAQEADGSSLTAHK